MVKAYVGVGPSFFDEQITEKRCISDSLKSTEYRVFPSPRWVAYKGWSAQNL